MEMANKFVGAQGMAGEGQITLREWACSRAYDNSDQRAKELPSRLHN